jgi:predicted peptidase
LRPDDGREDNEPPRLTPGRQAAQVKQKDGQIMTSRRVMTTVATLAILLCASIGQAQEVVDGFAARTFVGADGVRMPYRLFVPDQQARRRPLPIVIYLHGGGGVGTDNLRQISGGNRNGTHVWATPQAQARHPAFVVAPQLPDGNRWDARGEEGIAPYASLVIELLGNLSREFAIDLDRVYLTGQSLGGFGTWDLITKRPEVFAAAVPLCGGGAPSRARVARNLPIWVFHGAKDEVVRVAGSREMVAALRGVGSAVRYTEYPDVGHDVWTVAYVERGLADWLFGQKRVSR